VSIENGRISVEWPDTHHPAFDDIVDSIRVLVAEDQERHRGVVQYAHVSRPPLAAFREPMCEFPIDAETGFEVRTLRIHRAVGPAPYVGRPFVYTWEVAVDDFTRWVAGPARIQYLPDAMGYPSP
jgi:hypothetical protein